MVTRGLSTFTFEVQLQQAGDWHQIENKRQVSGDGGGVSAPAQQLEKVPIDKGEKSTLID